MWEDMLDWRGHIGGARGGIMDGSGCPAKLTQALVDHGGSWTPIISCVDFNQYTLKFSMGVGIDRKFFLCNMEFLAAPETPYYTKKGVVLVEVSWESSYVETYHHHCHSNLEVCLCLAWENKTATYQATFALLCKQGCV